MLSRPCPSCQQSGPKLVSQLQDAERSGEYSLGRCSRCNLLFVLNPPEDLTPHYFLDDGHEMSKVRNSLLDSLREHLLYRDARPLLSSMSRSESILDLGCGDGAFVRVLRKRGYAATGADVHEGNRASLPREHYLQLRDFNLESLIQVLDTIRPTAVIMRHVLEHVVTPSAVVDACRGAGVRLVLIVVPNVESRMRRIFRSNWYYWDPPRHLSFFSPQTLRDTFDRGGYTEVVSQTYGLDEVAVSIYRAMRINPRVRRLVPLPTKIFHARGALSSALSIISYPCLDSVIRAVFENRGS